MNAMKDHEQKNAPVDVLAELDRRLVIGELFGQEHDIPATELAGTAALRAARAAVSELIEAASALTVCADGRGYFESGQACRRFRAALARVGGAK